MSEKSRLNKILVAVSALPKTLIYRNNTGQAWQGKPLRVKPGQTVIVQPGMVVLREARPISFGLAGSGDAMGACQGRPVAIEVKDEDGVQSDVQEAFQAAWEAAGGIYLLVKEPQEAVKKLLAVL